MERSKRLERLLGPVKTGMPRKGEREISGLPDGKWLEEGVYLVEESFPLSRHHGKVLLKDLSGAAQVLSEWGATENAVFLDLETTGLAGGTGTYAFLAGAGRVMGNAFVVRQLFLSTPRAEKPWLDHLFEWIEPASGFVTYNGKRFDLPILQTRAILNRKDPLAEEKGHLDLLYLARALWKGRLPDCRLGTIEAGILGVNREYEDVPGWLVPQHYADFLRTGDARPLSGVFIHNKTDILSLASLKIFTAAILKGNAGSFDDLLRSGDLWASRNRLREAEKLWCLAGKHSSEDVTKVCLRLAFAAKRRQRWDQAAELFERSLGNRSTQLAALVELAKIFEHKFCMYEKALEYAEEALARHRENRPFAEVGRWSDTRGDLLKRIERLRKKIADRT
jgi:uncharacterized protein YprB with RNaseH-like and TPR domain